MRAAPSTRGAVAAWLDVVAQARENLVMIGTRTKRKQLARALNAAYAGGLISQQTFAARLEEVLNARLIDVNQLVGDLRFRAPQGSVRDRISRTVTTLIGRIDALLYEERPMILALDWSGPSCDLLIGRSSSCDVVLSDPTVSRRHALVTCRDAAWVFQDLASTNGSVLNGRTVGRSELRPGDRLVLGESRLLVD
jgi:FHA domain